MTTIGEPRIDFRAEQRTMGIRIQTPFKGMLAQADTLFKELDAWARTNGVKAAGARFLRLYVIDMAGPMDIEAGIPVDAVPDGILSGGERVRAGILPAGRYVSLIYSGSGLSGNKALHEWARANGLVYDRWDDPRGDAFRARYESYLTDPKVEPRKTRWQVEVAIKLADDAA